MSKAKLLVKRATPEEIRKLLRKDEKYMVGVRLYAVYQIATGAVSRDLEKIYNVSFKSVCNWVHDFNEHGLEGLKDETKSGRKPRLNNEQLESIKATIISDEPTKYNYNTSTWTGPVLIDFIERQFGIRFKKAQIYNILKKLGLSHQKGKAVYPEADTIKRATFISELKKTKNKNQRRSDIV
jgi:transposase